MLNIPRIPKANFQKLSLFTLGIEKRSIRKERGIVLLFTILIRAPPLGKVFRSRSIETSISNPNKQEDQKQKITRRNSQSSLLKNLQ
jgi:hypothetical protein